jgi:5-hydroxyisourate hydrolase
MTTHVLDTARGCPAAGVPVALDKEQGGTFVRVGQGTTDADGRVRDLTTELSLGTYRITFDTQAYWAKHGVEGFYPEVSVLFTVKEGRAHYHVPLLLSPWGYSTYRGS